MDERNFGLWVRINGNGHAFGRELGCTCGRCCTIRRDLAPPPDGLKEFAGWDDPPVRIPTSVSLLVDDGAGVAVGHVLVDVGLGVVDSLANASIPGVENVSAVLLSHWHHDHSAGLNQLGENLRRSSKRQGRSFVKAPLFCTLATYEGLRDHGGLSYVLERCFRFQEIIPETPFTVETGGPPLRVTPLPVVHGNTQGAAIYVVAAVEKKIVCAWDLETPESALPDGRTNLEIFRQHESLLRNADLHVQECNSWSVPGRGHCTYNAAQAYFEIVRARRTLVTHLSGHEDGPGQPGYGWTDDQWQSAVEKDGIGIARQAMVIRL